MVNFSECTQCFSEYWFWGLVVASFLALFVFFAWMGARYKYIQFLKKNADAQVSGMKQWVKPVPSQFSSTKGDPEKLLNAALKA